jgi:hypothetical protein
MKSRLLYVDRDVEEAVSDAASADLVTDLDLERIFVAMGGTDRYLVELARTSLATGLATSDEIRYRQSILGDAMRNPAMVRRMYAVAVDAIEGERRVWGAAMRNAELVLQRSVTVLKIFLGSFRELRRIQEMYAQDIESPGFRTLFDQIAVELGDEDLEMIEHHLERLGSRTIAVSARLGPGNRGTDYVLRRPIGAQRGLRERVGLGRPRGRTIDVLLSDQNAMNSLGELRALAVAPAAGAIRESVEHILGFFACLRAELGFYVCAMNLHDALRTAEAPICMPVPIDPRATGAADGGTDPEDGTPRLTLSARRLVDPGLCLASDASVVGNDIDADGRLLLVVTGANHGGKSTFLRSVGIAHLMMQAGLFVTADGFSADVRSRVATHFTRDEDPSVERGKLDEELDRLDGLLDDIDPSSLLLMNESFGSTNERDGAEIARRVISGLADAGVKVVYVTHLHEFAERMYGDAEPRATFLRAERDPNGVRSFRIVPAPPLPTSFGADIYRDVFGEDAATRDPTHRVAPTR